MSQRRRTQAQRLTKRRNLEQQSELATKRRKLRKSDLEQVAHSFYEQNWRLLEKESVYTLKQDPQELKVSILY